MVFGFDETAMAYDLQRAHSADVWFIKVRAWFWAITATSAGLLLGNILGVVGVNFFGSLFLAVEHIISLV
jgi:hypothetical protein